MADKLNELPGEMLLMAREAALRERPEDGFVSSMHTDGATGRRNKLLIYAWGESAHTLAEKLNLIPVTPAWATRRGESREEFERDRLGQSGDRQIERPEQPQLPAAAEVLDAEILD